MYRRKMHKLKKGNVCTAAGLQLYTLIDDEPHFIIQYRDDTTLYEDFGGVADHKDSSPLTTAIRETVEETNAGLFTGYTKDEDHYYKKRCKEYQKYLTNYKIHQNRMYGHFYKRFKYMAYLYYIPFSLVRLQNFDTYEYQEGIPRTVHIFDYNTYTKLIKDNKCNPRLQAILEIFENHNNEFPSHLIHK